MKLIEITLCFPVIIALILGCTTVDTRSMSKGTVSDNSGKYTPSAGTEEYMWERTKEANNLEYYEHFLREFPNSHFADNARDELSKFAKVTVSLPNRIFAGRYFEIMFTEANGVGVVLEKLNYTLRTADGKTWNRRGPELARSDWIIVPANGKAKTFINVPLEWGGGRVEGYYAGKDANGHNIKIKFKYDVTGK